MRRNQWDNVEWKELGKTVQRDYWIYQQRQSETAQWAIYVVKEFDRRNPENAVLNFTVYSEDIGNKTNSESYDGWHYDTVVGYVIELVFRMLVYTSVTWHDVEQLYKAITDVLEDRR